MLSSSSRLNLATPFTFAREGRRFMHIVCFSICEAKIRGSEMSESKESSTFPTLPCWLNTGDSAWSSYCWRCEEGCWSDNASNLSSSIKSSSSEGMSSFKSPSLFDTKRMSLQTNNRPAASSLLCNHNQNLDLLIILIKASSWLSCPLAALGLHFPNKGLCLFFFLREIDKNRVERRTQIAFFKLRAVHLLART